MYYEEKIIGGIKCYRNTPDGIWYKCSEPNEKFVFTMTNPPTDVVLEALELFHKKFVKLGGENTVAALERAIAVHKANMRVIRAARSVDSVYQDSDIAASSILESMSDSLDALDALLKEDK